MIPKRIFVKGPRSQQSPHADKRHPLRTTEGDQSLCCCSSISNRNQGPSELRDDTGWGGNSIKADLKSGAASEITAAGEAGAFKVRI